MSALSQSFLAPVTRGWRRLAALGGLTAGFLVLFGGTTQTVIANGDTRSISMVHRHTGETIMVTFKRFGRYDQQALQKLNWFLRDWRNDQATRMDPQVFDVLWEVHRTVGASSPIHVVSAYRSPGTNAMLRRRSRGVAKHSQHIQGRAVDFYIPGASMTRVREAGMRLQRGGVGFYPSSASQFVHLDTGSVRHWPKVSRDYLARLFPDGRTVHIPSDGRPMPGFDAALAMVRARGGNASRSYDSSEDESAYPDNDDPSQVVRQRSTSMGLFAGLFGGNQAREAPNAPAVAERPRAPVRPVTTTATRVDPAPVVTTTTPVQPAPSVQPAAQPAPVVPTPPPAATQVARLGPPTAITPAQPRMLIAQAPLPVRAPPASVRAQGADDEDEADSASTVAQAPLPQARPQSLVAQADLRGTSGLPVAEPQPGAPQPGRPTPLPETVTAMAAPLPAGRPSAIGGSLAQLPALITTGDQRGRPAGEPAPPAVALAFASPTQAPVAPVAAAAALPQPVIAPPPAPVVATAPLPRSNPVVDAPARGAGPGPTTAPAARPVRATAPAPTMIAPSLEGQRARAVLVADRVDRSRQAASLTTPDPRQVRLIEAPAQVVANGFATGALVGPSPQGFSGRAIVPVRTLDFVDAPTPQRRASLDRAN